MDDTPQHIKDLQLKIWMDKPPMERLRQFLVDNEALYLFWRANKPDGLEQVEQPNEKNLVKQP